MPRVIKQLDFDRVVRYTTQENLSAWLDNLLEFANEDPEVRASDLLNEVAPELLALAKDGKEQLAQWFRCPYCKLPILAPNGVVRLYTEYPHCAAEVKCPHCKEWMSYSIKITSPPEKCAQLPF